jgi:hypothetical protein
MFLGRAESVAAQKPELSNLHRFGGASIDGTARQHPPAQYSRTWCSSASCAHVGSPRNWRARVPASPKHPRPASVTRPGTVGTPFLSDRADALVAEDDRAGRGASSTRQTGHSPVRATSFSMIRNSPERCFKTVSPHKSVLTPVSFSSLLVPRVFNTLVFIARIALSLIPLGIRACTSETC